MNLPAFLGSRLPGLLRFAMVLVNDRERAELLVEQAVLRVADAFPDGDDPDVLYAAGRVWVARGLLAQDMVLGNPAASDVDTPRAVVTDGAALPERVDAVSHLARTVLVLRYRELMPPAAIAGTVGSTPDGILAYLDHVLDTLGVRHRRRAADAAPSPYREDDLENLLDRHGVDVRADVTAVRRTLSIALGYLAVDVPATPPGNDEGPRSSAVEPETVVDTGATEVGTSLDLDEPVKAETVETGAAAIDRVQTAEVAPEDDPDHADRVTTALALTEHLRAERQATERVEAERVEAERQEAERVEAERVEAERVEAESEEAEPAAASPDWTQLTSSEVDTPSVPSPSPDADRDTEWSEPTEPGSEVAWLDLTVAVAGPAAQDAPATNDSAGPPDSDSLLAAADADSDSDAQPEDGNTRAAAESTAPKHRRHGDDSESETGSGAGEAGDATAGKQAPTPDNNHSAAAAAAVAGSVDWLDLTPKASGAVATVNISEWMRSAAQRIEHHPDSELAADTPPPAGEPDAIETERRHTAEAETQRLDAHRVQLDRTDPEPAETADAETADAETADAEPSGGEPASTAPQKSARARADAEHDETARLDAIEAVRVAVFSTEARGLEAHRALLDRDDFRRRAAERRAGERPQRSRRRSRRGVQQEPPTPDISAAEPASLAENEMQWLDLSVRHPTAPPRVAKAKAPALTADEIDSILLEHLAPETHEPAQPHDRSQDDADLLDLTPVPRDGRPDDRPGETTDRPGADPSDDEPTTWVNISRRRLVPAAEAPEREPRPAAPDRQPRRPPNTQRRRRRRGSMLVLAVVTLAVLASIVAILISRESRTDARGVPSGTASSTGTPSAASASPSDGIEHAVDRAMPGSRVLESHSGAGPATVSVRLPKLGGGRELAVAASCAGSGPVQIATVLLRSCADPGIGAVVASDTRELQVVARSSTRWEFAVIDQPAAATNGSLIPLSADALAPPASLLLGDRTGTGTGTLAIKPAGGASTSDVRIALTCRGAGVRLSSSDRKADGNLTDTCLSGLAYQFDVRGLALPSTLTVAGKSSTSWHVVISRL